jgi:WD40 repeat protein
MDFDRAVILILDYLEQNRGATNYKLIELIGGDQDLFEKVKEHLIFNDLADDKKGVGLKFNEQKMNFQNDQDKFINQVPTEQKHSRDESTQSLKIFISYGRKDAEELAFKLAKDLSKLNHQVWLDKEQIKTGRSWEQQIEKAIFSSDIFISLLSPHAVRRPDGVCLDEISMARYNNRRIIPLMVINCRPPLGIYRLDWLDIQDWGNQIFYEKTFQQIENLIEEKENSVEGINACIFNILKPIDFKLDIYRHVKDFTGREWLINDIRNWVENSVEKILFITGDPGSGKTALMAKLIHLLPQIGAYHFCISKFETSLIPEKFIHSIASQLATQLPEYREYLSQINLETIAFQETSALIKQLIVSPLSQIQRDEPIVIIIDALDEALYYGQNNIAELLYNWLDDFPSWIKLIITSRKVPAIIQLFEYTTPWEINISRKENELDIIQFVRQILIDNPDFTVEKEKTDELIQTITQKSEGIFLYAKFIVQGLLSKTITISDIKTLPPGLSGIYQTNFKRIFEPEGSFEQIKSILEIILATYNPLTPAEIASFSNLNLNEIKKQLSIIGEFFPEREGTVTTFHKSLADWLSGSQGLGHRFLCDLNKGHSRISDILLNQLKTHQLSEYLLQYLPKHLYHSNRFGEMQYLMTSIYYLEERSKLRQTYSLIEDYKLLLSVFPEKLSEQKMQEKYIWDEGRHQYETQLIIKSLTGERMIYFICSFFYRHAELVQLYGNIPGFLSQMIQNEGLNPFIDQKEHQQKACSFYLTGYFQKHFDPFPSVLKYIYEHKIGISDLSLGKVANCLASSGFDKIVRLWNLSNGECLKSIKFKNIIDAIALASDASYLVMAGGKDNYTISVYTRELDQILFQLEGHTDRVTMMRLSDDNGRMISGSNDKSFIVWDMKTRSRLYERKYDYKILSCTISGDGSVVAVNTSDNLIEVWNVVDEKLLFSQRLFKGEVRSVLLSHDCRELVIGGGEDKKTEIWDIHDQKLKYKIDGHGDATYCLALNSSKDYLITGGKDRFLKIWDFRKGSLIKTFESHSRLTRRLVTSDDFNMVITGSGWNSDDPIRIWDIFRSRGDLECDQLKLSVVAVCNFELLNIIIGVNRKAIFSINTKTNDKKVIKDKLSVQNVVVSNRAIFISLQNGYVHSYQPETGKWEELFQHTDMITSMIRINENDWLFGDRQGKVFLYRNKHLTFFNDTGGLKIKNMFQIRNYYVLAGSDDQFVFVNRETGRIDDHYKHSERIASNIVQWEGSILFGDIKGNIVIYDPAQKTPRINHEAHQSGISCIGMHIQTNRLITGCLSGNIKIWDPKTFQKLLEFKGHDSCVNFIEQLPDSNFLSVSGVHNSNSMVESEQLKDTTLKKWNLFTGNCLGVYPANDLITALNTDDQGKISIGQRNGLIYQFQP